MILKDFGGCVKENLVDADLNRIAKEVSKLYHDYQKRWRASSFKDAAFEKKNGAWARLMFKLPLSVMIGPLDVVLEPGEEDEMPLSSFEQQSDRTQRRIIQNLRESVADLPVHRLLKAVAGVAKEQKGSASEEQKTYLDSVAYICSNATKSPTRPQKIVSSIQESEEAIRKYTLEEALALNGVLS